MAIHYTFMYENAHMFCFSDIKLFKVWYSLQKKVKNILKKKKLKIKERQIDVVL